MKLPLPIFLKFRHRYLIIITLLVRYQDVFRIITYFYMNRYLNGDIESTNLWQIGTNFEKYYLKNITCTSTKYPIQFHSAYEKELFPVTSRFLRCARSLFVIHLVRFSRTHFITINLIFVIIELILYFKTFQGSLSELP